MPRATIPRGEAPQHLDMAQQHLDMLDRVFGPEYFENGRLVLTVARDIAGMMKIAHKLQARVHESFGAMVEVIMEHVKYEWWAKLHETTATMGLHKGEEAPECQVTHIPDGIRQHPYKRDHLPTLEVLLLWDDVCGTTRGHCLFSLAHPDTPALEQVDQVFAEIEPWFAKRWALIQLQMGPPRKGDLEEVDMDTSEEPGHEEHVGVGVEVTILSCHAYGFAREQANGAAHVSSCQPIATKAITDDAGRVKVCFLPADINKVQVTETDRFYGAEVVLPRRDICRPEEGPTTVKVSLTPKSFVALTVHVFVMPKKLPAAEDTDGIVDWASEEREGLPWASVEFAVLNDGAVPQQLAHIGDGAFIPEDGGLPEGCVSLTATCPGYEPEERVVMLLVGANDVFVPLRRVC